METKILEDKKRDIVLHKMPYNDYYNRRYARMNGYNYSKERVTKSNRNPN